MSQPMVANSLSKAFALALTAGQQLQIQVLDSSGAVVSTLCTDSVPANNSFNGSVSYGGILSQP
jgi:hypothetical protein